MQNHYRDKFDIIALILDIANGNEARQADILIKANIPYTLFKEYLFSLYRYGLIEMEYIQRQCKRTYRTTAKGIHFLGICNKMRAFCDISPSENKPGNMELSVLRVL
jgi:predicted transcriptional regulator